MSNNSPRAVIPNLGYNLLKEAVKGYASEKRLGTTVLSYHVYCGPRYASVSTCCSQMAGQFLFRHQRWPVQTGTKHFVLRPGPECGCMTSVLIPEPRTGIQSIQFLRQREQKNCNNILRPNCTNSDSNVMFTFTGFQLWFSRPINIQCFAEQSWPATNIGHFYSQPFNSFGKTAKHTYIHKYIRTYVHTYISTYERTYIRAYISTYTHTHTHTHTHIQVQLWVMSVAAEVIRSQAGKCIS